MAYTTAAQVATIIEVDDTIDLDAFIDTAHELVEELCTDSGYTTTRLELIERWLSAHFYAIRDARIKLERAGPVAAHYQHELGLNLADTMYGQQAMLIDTAGSLAALSKRAEEGKRKGVGVTWLGTGDSDGNDTSGE